jgi:hypothetical protein
MKSMKSSDDLSHKSERGHKEINALAIQSLLGISTGAQGQKNTCSGFSSLLYIAKKLNEETKMEHFPSSLPVIQEELESTRKFVEESRNLCWNEYGVCEELSTEEWLGYISIRTAANIDDDFLSISNGHSEWIQALKKVHKNITGRNMLVDKNENIHLWIDLENDQDRELMTTLAKIKLPEIYTIKLSNFYENDDDLENFISNSLVTVWNFIFISESYWVDIHDYISKILTIPSIKQLYFKGFLVDSIDFAQLLACSNAQRMTFESCNIAIDEEFDLNTNESTGGADCIPVLESLSFVDVDLDEDSMARLAKAVKESDLKRSFKEMRLSRWSLDEANIRKMFE